MHRKRRHMSSRRETRRNGTSAQIGRTLLYFGKACHATPPRTGCSHVRRMIVPNSRLGMQLEKGASTAKLTDREGQEQRWRLEEGRSSALQPLVNTNPGLRCSMSTPQCAIVVWVAKWFHEHLDAV